MKKWYLPALVIVAAVAIMGAQTSKKYDYPRPEAGESLLIGAIRNDCTVYFRKDAFGIAAENRAGMLDFEENQFRISGRLLDVTPEWVILEPEEESENDDILSPRKVKLIPQQSILYIDTTLAPIGAVIK